MRLFFGIPISSEVSESIFFMRDDLIHAGIRPTVRNNLHVTVKFLKDANEKQIINDFNWLALQKPFSAELANFGAFTNSFWVGVESNLLVALIKKINEQLGVEEDIVPHITIGRFKKITDKINLLAKKEQEFGVIDIDRVVLYSSELTATGAVYTIVKEFISEKAKVTM